MELCKQPCSGMVKMPSLRPQGVESDPQIVQIDSKMDTKENPETSQKRLVVHLGSKVSTSTKHQYLLRSVKVCPHVKPFFFILLLRKRCKNQSASRSSTNHLTNVYFSPFGVQCPKIIAKLPPNGYTASLQKFANFTLGRHSERPWLHFLARCPPG